MVKMKKMFVVGGIVFFVGMMPHIVSNAAEPKQDRRSPNKIDERVEIPLPAMGRHLILREMRQMLMASQGVISGLSLNDRALVERSARSAGATMAADINPAIREKLPQTFRGLGMSVHRDFDALADGIGQGETVQQILTRLSSLMSGCITCHESYKLSSQ